MKALDPSLLALKLTSSNMFQYSIETTPGCWAGFVGFRDLFRWDVRRFVGDVWRIALDMSDGVSCSLGRFWKAV